MTKASVGDSYAKLFPLLAYYLRILVIRKDSLGNLC